MIRLVHLYIFIGATVSLEEWVQKYQYKKLGCFKDRVHLPDLEYRSTLMLREGGVIEECVQDCIEHYYPYAGIQRGKICFCGSKYGQYGQSKGCTIPCAEKDTTNYFCGGPTESVIYSTGIKIPGFSTKLSLTKSRTNQLTISWNPPPDFSDPITGYRIQAAVNKSFDSAAYGLEPTELYLSDAASSATILGLIPASFYNVSVSAKSESGFGPSISALFWTDIAKPETPDTPVLIRSDSDKEGTIRIRLNPLEKNRYGPISKYRIVVINESEKVPVYPDSYADWKTASKNNLKYWIAAELDPTYFDKTQEFLIGDKKYYGSYYNYGPLNTSSATSDYHITVGVVSTLNNDTKISYAKVSHDQHAVENIVIFSFDSSKSLGGKTSGSSLVIILSVAIVVFGVFLGIVVGFYVYLRCGFYRSESSSKTDVQELAIRSSSVEISEAGVVAFANPMIAEGDNQDEIDSPVSSASQMEAIRRQVWSIPKESLDLSHEVIGRGRYGSIIRGRILRKPSSTTMVSERDFKVNIHVVVDLDNRKSLSRDLELVVRYSKHPNILQLLGLSDGDDPGKKTLFIILEESSTALKRILVESRALLHYPVFAEKHNRFTTLQETNVLEVLIGISMGMNHLARCKIFHKKLCARNIYLSPENVPKISGIGVAEFSEPGIENDYTRWSAQESFKSNHYVTKCDVWSFAVLMWEVVTLGGTPYADIKNREVPNRVQRGMRVRQTNYMSDDIYQLMLLCWQLDLETRPSFQDLEERLRKLATEQDELKHINFTHFSSFQYEMYVPELEVKSMVFSSSQYV